MPEFRQAAKAVIIVDIWRRAEDGPAQISNAYEIKDREALIRRFHEKVDVAVLASLVTRYRSIEEQSVYAKGAQLLTAVAKEAKGVISLHGGILSR